MKKSLLVCTLAALASLVCSMSAQAQGPALDNDLWWTDKKGDGTWNTFGNWKPGYDGYDDFYIPKTDGTYQTLHIDLDNADVTITEAYSNVEEIVRIENATATLHVNAQTSVGSLTNEGTTNVKSQLTTNSLSNEGTLNVDALLTSKELLNYSRIVSTANISVNSLYLFEGDVFLGGNELILRAEAGTKPVINFLGWFDMAPIHMDGGTVRLEGSATSALNICLGGDFSGNAPEYEVFTRVLMENGVQSNLEDYLASVDSLKVIAQGNFDLPVKVDELVADKDHLGNYRIYVDGNDLKISYVRGIPEPSTASLSLLALSALFIRRKRA